MAQPQAFLNRFRYAILAVLTIVTIAYGYYLYRLYGPAPQPAEAPSIPVAVMVDGTVRIDGALFTSPDKLKIKVASVQKEHPDAGFSLTAPQGTDFNTIAKAVVLLQKSGAKTIWVVNEQKKTPEKP